MANLWRLWKILFIFTKYRLDSLVPVEQLPLSLRIALWLAPWRLNPVPSKLNRGARLRLALEALGPIFVKFGQILSTRPDLIPDDIVKELRRLQDDVPPFDSDLAIALIEDQLGQKIEQLFSEFSPQPLASASIAQVHTARLPQDSEYGDQEVVVKVVRPGIENTIERDLQLLEFMAKLLVKYSADGRRLKPLEVVEDYRHTIYGELNLQIEASNATQLKRNFADSDSLYLPEVFWEYCRSKVMVSERIYGIPVADIEQLNTQNTNMKVLAERGVEIFFTQVFRDSFFHADMHPGNIFVSRNNPSSPQYIAIDCGIVGTLTEEDQHYLAMNLLAFFNQDYHQVAQLHIDSGWVPPSTKVHEFAAAIRSVCEPIFDKPLAEISFGQVLIQLFSTARRFNMEVQPQLVLLQKTLLNIEGLGRQLYPQLDLWSTAKPYLERWMRDRFGPKAAYQELKRQLPGWIEKAPQIPGLVHGALSRLNHMDENQQSLQQEIVQLHQALQQQQIQKRHQTLGTLTTMAGLFSWWQAFTLGIPEIAGLSLTGLGIVWLLLKA
ncbi:ubiquinone biosynthesis regulatory protein kinase UbiB [Bacterioplanoides sp. SCSIO 12839]|uniref:ubiquinone biosynthesis regulatory protein kinase UbiB n=1 Tax=Bacterioplanoides sp. SCSIO 12839 TaxID=2829569 RepID=UPI002103AC97|nr:ubiquinone biosynthesis regulatory protein kinase UbiB [Bacterioplanoides sp. SCSIO 12839]UTW48415.1 ubiquinone biosynthesis regulatory protein kinase UbiB [Bacterioplanoides sp. SCSIO 12839]